MKIEAAKIQDDFLQWAFKNVINKYNIVMIKFKDLKIGDIVSTLGYGVEYEITRIETSGNSTLNEGYMRLYYNNDWSYFSVLENKYYDDCGNSESPRFITPKENLKEFQVIYKAGIKKGEMDFKNKIKKLFEIE